MLVRGNSKYVLMAALIVSSVAACVGLFQQSSSADVQRDAMSVVVTRGSVEEVVLALGTLEPASMVRVGAQVTGQIKAIHAHIGQAVIPGDLLAEIDAIPQENSLRIAKAKVDDRRAQKDVKQIEIRYAESALRRQQSLRDRDAVSRKEFEEAEAKYQTLVAELVSLKALIEQSEVDLETAQANLAYTRITAPMKGTLVALPVEQGQTLNSAQTSPTVAVIANLDEMVVKIRISEADVWRTKAGQGAWFTIIGDPQTRYNATLEAVEYAPPSIANDPTQGFSKELTKDSAIYYHGVLRVKNPEGKLRTKMTAKVRISIGRAADVVLVPWAALSVRRSDGSYLVKVRGEGDKVEDRQVHIGFTDKIHAQVLNGLEEGETVLLDAAAPVSVN